MSRAAAPPTSPASDPPTSPASSGAGRAQAWLRTHRAQAAGGAAAAVAALALLRKHKAAATATSPAAAGVDAAGVTTPNTQSSDIENWVQDALNSQQAAVDAALANPGAPAGAPLPAPAPKTHFIYGLAAKGLKYVRDAATGAIYQVNPDGSLWHLTPAQYAELGKPGFTGYGNPPAKAKAPPVVHPAPKPKAKPIKRIIPPIPKPKAKPVPHPVVRKVIPPPPAAK